ncbi:MAG: hypothetical protein LBC81_02945 [Tannerellaceae bacterium]|nr:hypothetical protein [Tannerellaceae bacterium]
MKKLSKRGYQILKILHILTAGAWIGAVITAIALLLTLKGEYLARDLEVILFIDLALFIPCALATLLTGLVYSIFTQWGFVKHWWIIVKYLITLLPIFTGFPLVASKLLGMTDIVGRLGAGALADKEFGVLYNECLLGLIVYLVLFLSAYILSVIKPANRRKR